MSECTRQEILKLIEENDGPRGLDLSGKDLSGIDLSMEALAVDLRKVRVNAPGKTPVWSFGKGINLLGANLVDAKLQEANLHAAQLQGAILSGANLQEANLWGANLQGANLWVANLQEANLDAAQLQGAILWGAKLREANLREAQLQGADLLGADLQGANLYDANLQGAGLSRAHIEKVDFSVAADLEGAHFYNAFMDDTRMKREQLGGAIGEELEGTYSEAKEAYLALKNNFAEIGRYDDATWAYLKERRMEKLKAFQKAKDAWREHDWRVAIAHGTKVAVEQFVELLCDYGEGLGRVAGSLIALWLAFAFSYGRIAGVWGPWQDTGEEMIRYITQNPIDLLSFSLGAMTTLLPSGLEPRPILAMRILMPLEALIGIFLVALLGFVAGNRIRRS